MIDITNINTNELLSATLGISESKLKQFVSCSLTIHEGLTKEELRMQPHLRKINPSAHLLKMYIPKKNGKDYRIVYRVLDETLLSTIKAIQYLLNRLYKPLSCVHGFVPKRGVYSNAKNHLKMGKILRIDIRDFFPSIKINQVVEAFCKIGFKQNIAESLSKLTTANGELVQGLHTSPIIANIVAEGFDKELLEFSLNNSCTYTRYADDCYISTNNSLPEFKEITNILIRNGFEINEAKTLIMKRGKPQYVTGLTVFDDKYPRIPKSIKKQIRFTLYYLKKYGYKSCHFEAEKRRNYYTILSQIHLKGWIDYVNAIEPHLARQYYEDFKQIEWAGFDKQDSDEIHFFKYKILSREKKIPHYIRNDK